MPFHRQSTRAPPQDVMHLIKTRGERTLVAESKKKQLEKEKMKEEKAKIVQTPKASACNKNNGKWVLRNGFQERGWETHSHVNQDLVLYSTNVETKMGVDLINRPMHPMVFSAGGSAIFFIFGGALYTMTAPQLEHFISNPNSYRPSSVQHISVPSHIAWSSSTLSAFNSEGGLLCSVQNTCPVTHLYIYAFVPLLQNEAVPPHVTSLVRVLHRRPDFWKAQAIKVALSFWGSSFGIVPSQQASRLKENSEQSGILKKVKFAVQTEVDNDDEVCTTKDTSVDKKDDDNVVAVSSQKPSLEQDFATRLKTVLQLGAKGAYSGVSTADAQAVRKLARYHRLKRQREVNAATQVIASQEQTDQVTDSTVDYSEQQSAEVISPLPNLPSAVEPTYRKPPTHMPWGSP